MALISQVNLDTGTIEYGLFDIRSIYRIFYSLWYQLTHGGIRAMLEYLAQVWADLLPFLFRWGLILSALFFAGIVYAAFRLWKVQKEEDKKYASLVEEFTTAPEKNERWEKITTHVNSENPSDWRLAIIEADIMLGELLDAQGYHGDTIGDKLKSIEKSDFTTLDAAWEAHKVRNRIAHSGSDFILTQREARRIVSLFEAVFREFEVI